MEIFWSNFIKDLEIAVKKKISNLNPHREYILKDNQLRKRIILTEIKIKCLFNYININLNKTIN